MDPQEQAEMIKKAVGEAMDERMKDFYVEREQHYQHHLWIQGLIDWSNSCKTWCMKSFFNCLIAGLLALLVMGFIFWGGKAFKG